MNRYVLSDDVVFREIEGEVLIVPISSSAEEVDSIYTVGGSGARIVQMLTRPCSEGDLVDGVLRSYRVERQQALEDVSGFLSDLQANRLVRVISDSGS